MKSCLACGVSIRISDDTWCDACREKLPIDWKARALAAEAEVAALRENIRMLERIAHRWNNTYEP